jgi:hypothetical protein
MNRGPLNGLTLTADQEAAASSMMGLTRDGVPPNSHTAEQATIHAQSRSTQPVGTNKGTVSVPPREGATTASLPAGSSAASSMKRSQGQQSSTHHGTTNHTPPADHVWDWRRRQFLSIHSPEAYDLFASSDIHLPETRAEGFSLPDMWKHMESEDRIRFLQDTLRQLGSKRKLGFGRRERDDGCIEVDKALLIKAYDGSWQHPRGPTMKGYTWNGKEGAWQPLFQASDDGGSGTPSEDRSAKKKKAETARRVRADGSIEVDKSTLSRNNDGTWRHPRGASLRGYIWNAGDGLWDPIRDDSFDYVSLNPTIKKKLGRGCRVLEDGSIEVAKEFLRANRDGTWRVPQGGHLKGYTWNEVEGLWQPESESAIKRKLGPGRRELDDGSIEIAKELLIPNKDGTWRHPRGASLRGYTWNEVEGLWQPKFEGTVQQRVLQLCARSYLTLSTLSVKGFARNTDNDDSSQPLRPRLKSTEKKGRGSAPEYTSPTKVLHKQVVRQNADGTFIRPIGRPPMGYEWDERSGKYVQKDGDQSRRSLSPSKLSRKSYGSNASELSKYKKPALAPVRTSLGTYVRPVGRPPIGYIWNQMRGEWEKDDQAVDSSSLRHSNTAPSSRKENNSAGRDSSFRKRRQSGKGKARPFRPCGQCLACQRRRECGQCYNCLLAQWCSPYPLADFYTCVERICKIPVLTDHRDNRTRRSTAKLPMSRGRSEVESLSEQSESSDPEAENVAAIEPGTDSGDEMLSAQSATVEVEAEVLDGKPPAQAVEGKDFVI